MSRKKPENLSFEEAMEELERVVAQLEQGDLPLDQGLKAFERGVALMRSCRQSLEQAEQKVRILSEKSLDAQTEPFSAE